MRTDYLNVTKSVVLDANGNGTVELRPIVGQFWAPTLVRVSTNSANNPSPYCSLYHGASSLKDSSAFIDDTYLGNSDSSSMICGVIVQFGEAVTAKWTGGVAGDVAFMTLYGVTADTLPGALDVSLPFPPGVHFAGKPTFDLASICSTQQLVTPPASQDFANVTVPNNQMWDIRTINFQFATSAVAANRQIRIQITDPMSGTNVYDFGNGQNVMASQTVFFNFYPLYPLLHNLTLNPGIFSFSAPCPKLILCPGQVIKIGAIARQAGDQFTGSLTSFVYQKYRSA